MCTALVAWLAWQEKLGTPMGNTLVAGMVLVPLVALLSLRGAALRATQHIVTGQLAEITLRPAFHSLLLFIVPLLLFPLTPAVAMWLGAIAVAFALVVSHALLYRALPASVFSAHHEVASRDWWCDAIPMAMTEGMRLLQAHLLIFFLGGMVAISDVGIFRMATSVLLLVGMPVSLFNIVCMPLIARLHTRGERFQMQKMLKLVTVAMLGGVVLLSLPFLLAGESLLSFVFGKGFSAGNHVLAVLCIGIVTSAAFGINAALLNMTGHQRRVTFASAVALAILLLVSPPLILSHGIMGAAISDVISVVTWNFLVWRDCRRLLGLDPGIWAILDEIRK